ncbi:SURF1 family protein [Aquiluna sp.]|nr:SURF1 family protein [Aquiluna sp.]MDA9010497.1 SURF1 family protein [Aquiluna sp.]
MTQSTLRRWGPWLALVVLFSIATSLLSWWQFSRRAERVEKINMVIENYDAAAVGLEDVRWTFTSSGEPENEWKPVSITGRYLVQEAVLVRNRPLSGQSGFVQVVPFLIDSGEILLVERGWLPTGQRITEPQLNPMPADGYHDLTVRLRAAEPDLQRDKVQGQLASIHPADLEQELAGRGTLITEFYGRLAAESPTYEISPMLMPKPSLNEGNHLSYAFQWIIFGLMAFIAFGWAFRNERRIQKELSGELTPKKQKNTQARQDAVFEDANQ